MNTRASTSKSLLITIISFCYLHCCLHPTSVSALTIDLNDRKGLKSQTSLSLKIHDAEELNIEINLAQLDANIFNLPFDKSSTQNNNFSFTHLNLNTEDSVYTTEVGKPEIPLFSKWIEIDMIDSDMDQTDEAAIEKMITRQEITNDQNNKNIQNKDIQYVELNKLGLKQIKPVQPPLPKTKDALKGRNILFNKNFYQTNTLWPEKDFEVVSVIQVRGKKYALLSLYPIKYNPAKNTLQIQKYFRLNLKFSGTTISEQTPEFTTFAFNDATIDNTKSLLIIVADSLKNTASLADFIKSKQENNFNITVKNIKEIGNKDLSIRKYVQEVYRNSIPQLTHLLLIGDTAEIATHQGSAGGHYQPTDHYYSAIDKTSYESDIGGPDIAVSRISAKNTKELDTMLRKFIKYQTRNFVDVQWLSQASFIATNDQWKIAEATHNTVIKKFTTPMNYHGNYPVRGLIGGDKLYAISQGATRSKLLSMLQEGRAIVNYSGHGDYRAWLGPEFYVSDVLKLKHPDANPFVIANACSTNTFSRIDDSFGEVWIKHPYGAIAYWGSSNTSYWDEDDTLEKGFFSSFFANKDATSPASVGELVNQARQYFWRYYQGKSLAPYYMELYNLVGDGSLSLQRE
ncbi:MAG: hypothetical protein HQK53_04960 [Oligoflexia bacterium]|nr:hypothetical protein [Oligoflexia bacterium]